MGDFVIAHPERFSMKRCAILSVLAAVLASAAAVGETSSATDGISSRPQVFVPSVVTNAFRISFDLSCAEGRQPNIDMDYRYSRTPDDPEAKWRSGTVNVGFQGWTHVWDSSSTARSSCIPVLTVRNLPGGTPTPGEKRRVEIVHKGGFLSVYQEVGGKMCLILRSPVADWVLLRSVSFREGMGTVSDLKLSVADDAPDFDPVEERLRLPTQFGASARFTLRTGIHPAEVRFYSPEETANAPLLLFRSFDQKFTSSVKVDGKTVSENHRIEDTGLQADFGERDVRSVYSITRIAARYRGDQIVEMAKHFGDYGEPASQHDFLYEIRRLDDGWGLWMDGNFVGRLKIPAGAAEVVVAAPAEATFRRLPDGGAAADRMRLALPVPKPFDTSVCKVNLGTYFLECDGYLSREPTESQPDSFLRRVPADTYAQAVVRCRVDPAPTNSCELTARLTNFHCPSNEGRSPAMMTWQTKTLARRAGEQTVVFDFEPGKIQDLIHDMGYDYLDFELLGGLNHDPVVYSELSYQPSPQPSGVTVLGVELVRAPASLRMSNGAYGNVFVEGEKASVTAEVAAVVSGDYRLAWEVKDLDGKVVETAKEQMTLSAGESWRKPLVFKAQNIGWYSYTATLEDASGRKVVRFPGAYAVIARDTRKAGYESPFFTWNSIGTLDTNGFRRIAAFLKKVGVRRTQLKKYTEEDAKEFGLTLGEAYSIHPKGATQAEKEADFERQAREIMAKWPHVDSALILHENGSSGLMPLEIQGGKTELKPEQLARQKEMVDAAIWRAKIWRKVAPHVRLKVGNNGHSLDIMGDLFRGGYPKELIDWIGEESVGMQVTPERSTGMAFRLLKDLAEHYGYTNGVAACYEWKDRVRRFCTNDRKNAAWYMRDILMALAWGSPQVTVHTDTEIGNSYFNTVWGAGAFTHGPVMQPLPHIAAVANLTRMLDRCKFSRLVPTGSQTAYLLEFRDPDGKYVYAAWTARGIVEAKFRSEARKLTVFDLYGREDRRFLAAKFKAAISEEPTYFWMDGPIVSSDASGERSYPWEEYPGLAGRKTLAPLRSLDGWTVDTNIWPQAERRAWMAARAGSFAAENGADGVVAKTTRAVAHHDAENDYGFIRPLEPIPVPEAATTLTLDVKGNSTWGKLLFEIEDAKGHRFLTAPSYYDSSDTVAFNFDGWNTLQFMIRIESPAKCNAVWGRNMRQWCVQGVPGKPGIEYPVKVTGLGFEFVRRGFNLLEWTCPDSDSVTVRNLSCY